MYLDLMSCPFCNSSVHCSGICCCVFFVGYLWKHSIKWKRWMWWHSSQRYKVTGTMSFQTVSQKCDRYSWKKANRVGILAKLQEKVTSKRRKWHKNYVCIVKNNTPPKLMLFLFIKIVARSFEICCHICAVLLFVQADKTQQHRRSGSAVPAANKEEISMPEASENQHRCGYTPPPLPGTMALSVKLTGAAVTVHSGNVYWPLRTAFICLAVETYDHFRGSVNMLCIHCVWIQSEELCRLHHQ